MISKALMSSNRMDWETPPEIFNPLNDEFHFTLDVCATNENHKCEYWITPEEDGLYINWASEYAPSVCWMNPPYGREIGKWVKRAYEQSQKGATVVCLVPSRTDTAWWHDWAMNATEIRYIRGRIRFVDAPYSAPFPSAILVFRPEATR